MLVNWKNDTWGRADISVEFTRYPTYAVVRFVSFKTFPFNRLPPPAKAWRGRPAKLFSAQRLKKVVSQKS